MADSSCRGLQHRLFICIAVLMALSVAMFVIVLGCLLQFDFDLLLRVWPSLVIILSPYCGLAAINKWLARECMHFQLLWFITILIAMASIYLWCVVVILLPTIFAGLIGSGIALYQWAGVLIAGVMIILHRMYTGIRSRHNT